MKSILRAILVVAFALALGSCFFIDGDAYIAYSWVYSPIWFYYLDDPAFAGATTIYNGEYLATRPGTYYFEYEAYDYSYWIGYYTIYINDGEFLSPGDDIYFELACYSFGPSFYEWSYAASEDGEDSAVPSQSGDQAEIMLRAPMDGIVYDNFETITKGRYTIELYYTQIK